MPDFSAISKAIGGLSDILKGITGAFGSLTGDTLGPALEGIGFGSEAAEA